MPVLPNFITDPLWASSKRCFPNAPQVGHTTRPQPLTHALSARSLSDLNLIVVAGPRYLSGHFQRPATTPRNGRVVSPAW